MTKLEFIMSLNEKLDGMPKDELIERLEFYTEMIDDRIEEGLSEEEAVDDIGSVDEIASQIIADIPLAKIVKNKIKPKRRLGAWEIVLLSVGSPIWISLIVALLAIIISVCVSFWSVVISLWSVFVSFAACSFAGVVFGVLYIVLGKVFFGIALVAATMVLAGFSIFAFFGCKYLTRWAAWLTKRFFILIKKCFAKKEGV